MSDELQSLIQALCYLPGVGPKSAQRMVFHLLRHHRQKGLELARHLEHVMQNMSHCARCHNYTSQTYCSVCQNPDRDTKTVCVVEYPYDIPMIEKSGVYEGTYFVLMGKISPLDGLGPEDIGIPKLYEVVMQNQVEEIILALSPTLEGQTTMHFIQSLFQNHPVKISQLALGIPYDCELEVLDTTTIKQALRNRVLLATN